MPILNLPAYPHDEWPRRVWDAMNTPAGAKLGALSDAMEADADLLKNRGRHGDIVQNHNLKRDRQLRSGQTWRGTVAGFVLIRMLAKQEAGEKIKSFEASLREIRDALEKSLGHHKGGGLTELKATWLAWRPVAHLWAAQNMRSIFELYDEHALFLEWISGAEDLRRRGEALRPPWSRVPILDSGTTWRMPDDLVLPSVTVPLPSVDTILSEIARHGPRLTT